MYLRACDKTYLTQHFRFTSMSTFNSKFAGWMFIDVHIIFGQTLNPQNIPHYLLSRLSSQLSFVSSFDKNTPRVLSTVFYKYVIIVVLHCFHPSDILLKRYCHTTLAGLAVAPVFAEGVFLKPLDVFCPLWAYPLSKNVISSNAGWIFSD